MDQIRHWLGVIGTLIVLTGFSATWAAPAGTPVPVKPVTATAPTPSPVVTPPISQTPATTKPVAATPAKPAPARLWNLQDADILSIINEVSLETGKNFVVDPRVNGKISLISSKPVKPDEVYNLFLSVLGLLGYSAIPSGNVVKIVPNMESSEYATRVATQQTPGKGDEVIVRVIGLEHISANQILPIVRPMLPQWSNVSAYQPGNVLILLGRAGNINRIIDVIHQIDETSNNQIDVVHLHQAAAAQIATVLTNLQNSTRSTGEMPQLSIAPDERTNSILLSGNRNARLRMRLMISQLDTPSAGSQGNTEVVYLRYLQAKDFAPVLGKIAQNILGKDTGGKGSLATTTVVTSTPGPPPIDTSISNNYPLPTASSTSTSTEKPVPENTTSIQAEPNTNALIITAPPTLMKALNQVISKLDIRPAQVLIEGVIVELDESDLKNLGIQWGTLVTPDTPNATSGAITDFPAMGAGNWGIIPHTQIRAVLDMLENKTGADILSTPSVVVLDNQKASLEVGKDVPVTTGSYATTGSTSTVTPFNTTAYRKVALSLNVTPQINLGCAVRLKITVSNDTLQDPQNPGTTPLINTSKIENSVIINSDDVLVLGGLISNDIEENINKVPLLGDVPVIGNLFQQKIRRFTKKNLVVFIKPIILHSAADSNSITNTKYEEIREEQIHWPRNIRSDGEQKDETILPPWKDHTKLPKPFEAA
ncbi:hypothetical protein AYO45_03095 [Gammaproteobacteria bacterium SCGC AG-212-F23]|nr:hypothetical protein AYO45_03095 [Gammaproteobacteria bacterium SCGC AG-212-F23]